MKTTQITVLNTNGEKIYAQSAVQCSYRNRHDLTCVMSGGNCYIVNNYSYVDCKAYFVGEYVKINRDLFYLLSRKYSFDKKQELFGVNMFFYEDMMVEISNKLKPSNESFTRLKNARNNLSLDIIREEIQNRLLGFDATIDTIYLIESLDNIFKPSIKEQIWYSFLLDAIKENDPVGINKYCKRLNFHIN